MSCEKCRQLQKCFCSNRKKVTKIDKNCTGSDATISYKIKFIGSLKFMVTSLSNLVDNLT